MGVMIKENRNANFQASHFLIFFLVIGVFLWLLWSFSAAVIECDSKGGSIVETLDGFICVKELE